MVERLTGKINPSDKFTQRYFYGIISITALLATLIVFIILSSNERPTEVLRDPVQPVKKERLAELSSILANDPENSVLNIEMGNQLFDIGKYREAIVYYKRVLQLDSAHMAARVDLGVCYFNLGMTDSALVEMRKSLTIDPDHIQGLFNIGVIYYNLGKITEAQRYWEKLIKQHAGSNEAQIARQMLENIKT